MILKYLNGNQKNFENRRKDGKTDTYVKIGTENVKNKVLHEYRDIHSHPYTSET